MTAPDHSYETAGDRASLAREAGVGKLSFISVLVGVADRAEQDRSGASRIE